MLIWKNRRKAQKENLDQTKFFYIMTLRYFLYFVNAEIERFCNYY